ncbi:hypothetical protein Ciccas_011524 [Cichlidogyrus casuarinus]|uniref:Uncharacterized protein n=1 Tax=Cichlidogyrus casuarinus TaxID=1844966 RepID=A0ABD2PSP2_9PLAT
MILFFKRTVINIKQSSQELVSITRISHEENLNTEHAIDLAEEFGKRLEEYQSRIHSLVDQFLKFQRVIINMRGIMNFQIYRWFEAGYNKLPVIEATYTHGLSPNQGFPQSLSWSAGVEKFRLEHPEPSSEDLMACEDLIECICEDGIREQASKLLERAKKLWSLLSEGTSATVSDFNLSVNSRTRPRDPWKNHDCQGSSELAPETRAIVEKFAEAFHSSETSGFNEDVETFEDGKDFNFEWADAAVKEQESDNDPMRYVVLVSYQAFSEYADFDRRISEEINRKYRLLKSSS